MGVTESLGLPDTVQLAELRVPVALRNAFDLLVLEDSTRDVLGF